MDPEEFNKISAAGADALNNLSEEFEKQGLDHGQLGSALLVALAAVMKNGDLTPQDIVQGLESLGKLWVPTPDGGLVLHRITGPAKDPKTEN